MLPLLVGGADDSLTANALPSRLEAEFHDQLPKVSAPWTPLAKGGGGVAGREREGAWDAVWSENDDKDSRIRWSSGIARLGDDGHAVDGVLDAENGDCPACHPCSRMSAEVCRLARLFGGSSTFDKGCGPGGGGGGALRRGED